MRLLLCTVISSNFALALFDITRGHRFVRNTPHFRCGYMRLTICRSKCFQLL